MSAVGPPLGDLTQAALLVACVVLTTSGSALANAAAPLHVPGNEGGAFIAQPTTLVVEHEELEFRCSEGSCEFAAVYHVRNPSNAREDVVGAFYGIETDRFATTADGLDARRALSPEEVRAIDDAVAGLDPALSRDKTIAREGFALGVDGHARATLVFSGRMRPVSGLRGNVVGYMALPPLETRHPWLATRARDDRTARYAYALSPIRHWAGSPNIDITVRCPSSACWAAGQEEWSVSPDSGGFAARRTIASRDASTLSFNLIDVPGTNVLHGGPLVGVGARLDAPAFRARLGYEAALPWWVVWSASAEADFKGTTTLIALGEVASPDLFVLIPSFGLGLGVPLQFRSGTGAHVGVRMQLTVSFPVVSIVLPVDVFEGGPSRDTWQVGLFAQASF